MHPPFGRTVVSLEDLRAEIETLTVPDEREAVAGFFDGAVPAVYDTLSRCLPLASVHLTRPYGRPNSRSATSPEPAGRTITPVAPVPV